MNALAAVPMVQPPGYRVPPQNLEAEAAAVAFEQAAWWRSRGLSATDAAAMLGIYRKSDWMDVESALRRRWREAVRINAQRACGSMAA